MKENAFRWGNHMEEVAGGGGGVGRWCETFTKQVRVRLSINHNMYCMRRWWRRNDEEQEKEGEGEVVEMMMMRWESSHQLRLIIRKYFHSLGIKFVIWHNVDRLMCFWCCLHCIFRSSVPSLPPQSIWAIDHFNWLCLALGERVPHLLLGRKISIKHVLQGMERTWFIPSNPSGRTRVPSGRWWGNGNPLTR